MVTKKSTPKATKTIKICESQSVALPPSVDVNLELERLKCGSTAEMDFISWLRVSKAPSEALRLQALKHLQAQVRYSTERRFVADFMLINKRGGRIFIEWEGAIGTHRSAYRSYSGYVNHANKYNWLATNGFIVIRLCAENKDSFWELWEMLNK